MQLKKGFILQTTATHLLPTPPAHNNNQPFDNVNLGVEDFQVSQDPTDIITGNDSVSVYSLYDDHSVQNGRPPDNADAMLPRPSENLRFLTNEYGFLELIDSDSDSEDDDSSCTDDSDEPKEPEDSDSEDNEPLEIPEHDNMDVHEIALSCVTCGCYGLKLEFFDAVHCSQDCSVITRINECKLKRAQEIREKKEKEKLEMEAAEAAASAAAAAVVVKRELEVDEEDEKEVDVKRIKLEVDHDARLDNPFSVNDLLEAIDPLHQSLFCPCIVTEVLGYRLLLKFIGYSDKYDFWVNADSINIFPVHWVQRYAAAHTTSPLLHFHCPQNFTWESYIAANPTFRVAPDANFPHIVRLLKAPETAIRVGMKVEAVDRRNKNLICVATITCVFGDRFLVHFDSWDSLYDYWTFSGSGDIHPVGYCKENRIDITPPHCYENASEFDWEEYLKKTNSKAIPRGLIMPPKHIPYLPGQMVEVIDKRSPRLLRSALIKQVYPKSQSVSIHFPSLKSSNYDYDVCAWSPDIHETGWGTRTGHPLADDEDEDDENDNRSPSPDHNFPMCPNHKICKSVCNVRGPNFPFHSKVRDCPYSPPNMIDFSESGKFTDRVVVFEDSHYDLGGGVKTNVHEQAIREQKPIVFKKPLKLELKPNGLNHKPQTPPLLIRNSNPINFNKFNGSLVKSVKNENCVQQIPKRSEILTWSYDRISGLVHTLCSNLPTAQKVADQFRNNLIDGESFLMLTQSDMTDALGIKLGPAVKIYNLIRLIDLNK